MKPIKVAPDTEYTSDLGLPPEQEDPGTPPTLQELGATSQSAPSLPKMNASMPHSILGDEVPSGEQIPDGEMKGANKAFKKDQQDQAHQERISTLSDFGKRDAAIRGQMAALSDDATIPESDYFQKLGVLTAKQGNNQAEKARFEKQTPWGTIGNHPGVFGKIGHVLGEIGTVAAPAIAEEIPGSQPYLSNQESQGQAKEKQGTDLATAEEKAQAAAETASAHTTTAGAAVKKANTGQQAEDTKETTLPNQLGNLFQENIGKGTDPMADPRVQQVLQGMKAGKTATSDKFQHVPGTIDGKPAFGAFNPADHKFYDPQTGAELANFLPPPNFAQTGSFQPTMVQTPDGQMVPGTLNARTGSVNVPQSNHNVAIPKDVQGEINKELDTARNADRRLAIMEHNLQTALKGDQQAMVSLVANHIGMTLGAQKGARINQAVWEEAVSSRPWLQGAQAKFDQRGYLSGVTLSPEQMNQMVDLAREVRDQQWNQANQTFGQYGIKINPLGNPPNESSAGGGESNTRPSVAEWLKSQHTTPK